MKNFWQGTLVAALKTTWLSMMDLLWQNPAVLSIATIIAILLNQYAIIMGGLTIVLLGDAVLGAMAAKEKFDWGILIKKTLFKFISYALGLAAFLILIYVPFNGQPDDSISKIKDIVILLMIANEYVSIVKNGKKLGVKLGPTFLLKGLKTIDETGKYD